MSTDSTQFRRALVLSLVLVLFGGHLQAACIYIEEVKLSDPFQFGKAYIESLYYVNSGSEHEGNIPTDSDFRSGESLGDLVGVVADFLYAIKLANADYECALDVVKPYTKSPDKWIQGVAGMAAMKYAALFLLNQKIMNGMKSVFDADEAQAPGKRAETLAELRFQKTEAWKGLLDVVAPASTYVFADMTEDPWSGKLRITARQRTTLESVPIVVEGFGAAA